MSEVEEERKFQFLRDGDAEPFEALMARCADIAARANGADT